MELREIANTSNRGMNLATALQVPMWAHHVYVKAGEKIPDAIARCNIHWLTLDTWSQPTLPDFIAKLPRLNYLEVRNAGKLRRLPDFVFGLQQLEQLNLEGSAIESLDGVERMPRVRAIRLARTPLGGAKAIREFAAQIPKGELSSIQPGTVFIDRPDVVPRDRAALVRAVQQGQYLELRKADASGGRFEGLDVYWRSPKANFAKTTWRHCKIAGQLTRCNFDGATFEECIFFDQWFDGISAKGATLRGCYFKECVMKGANLEGARFLDVAADSELDLSSTRAAKLVLDARFSSPDTAAALRAPKSDLRDASISLALTAGARRPGPTAAWPTTAFAGAKTNQATRIAYAPLAGAAPTKVSTAALPEPPKRIIVDRNGPSAPVLGRIDAANAGLWLLVADAKVAATWGGDEDEDGRDFARAEQASETGKPTLRVGEGHGLIVGDVGEHGFAFAYAIDHGIALLELGTVEDDFDESVGWKKLAKLHGAHVVQLAAKRRSKIGEVTVTSGALALLLPYAKLRKRGSDQLVLPLPNGSYEVIKERFADPPLTDEHGTYVGRVRIIRAGATVKSVAKVAKVIKPAKAPAVTGAVHLEFVEGTSRKFWEATVKGKDLTVRFGRIDTEGQRVTKSFASPAAAAAERDKLVAQKRRKGYG